MRLVFVTLFFAGIAALSCPAAEPAKSPNVSQAAPPAGTNLFNNVGVQEFEKLRNVETNVVLDVRTRREFARGHIPGAIHIDVNASDFEKKVAELDKEKTYLVLCGIGVRSAKACTKMRQLNFTGLYNLEGGMTAWQKAGHKPVR